MSATEITATLTAEEIGSVILSFSEDDATIANRVFTVGGLCEQHGIKPGDVFNQVNAAMELVSGQVRIVKGWSSSSIANAKTAYDLYLATGISPKIKRADRNALGGLIEDCRRIHGAKRVRATIVETVKPYADDIAPADRYDGVTSVLSALRAMPKDEKEEKVATPEDRFLSALRAADSLLSQVALSDEQVSEALALLANLSDALA